MLEDESGRVRLIGKIIEERKFPLVTGKLSSETTSAVGL